MNIDNEASWKVEPYTLNNEQFFSDWKYLSDVFHKNNQLLSACFVKNLLKYFHQDNIFLARGYQNKQLQCLVLLRKRNPLVWELYQPSQAQIALLVSNPDFVPNLRNLVTELPRLVSRVDFLGLDPAEHQAFINIINTSALTLHATDMQIHLSDCFESYWGERSKNLRKNMSRYENRLMKDNVELRFECVTDQNHIAYAVDRYGLLESQGWKGKIGTAIHPSNTQGQFYRSFMHELAKHNNAFVYECYDNDKLVASRLCCKKHDLFIILKTTFDENYKSYALGRLQLKQLIKFLYSDKSIKIIDFYTNASPEQLEWATHSRSIFNGCYYTTSPLGRALLYFVKLKNFIKRLKEKTH